MEASPTAEFTPAILLPTVGPTTDPEEINTAIIAGVIAAVFVTLLTVLVLIIVYLYKHKGSYVTNELQDEEANKALQGEKNSGQAEKEEYYM
ncbi:small cell adhesion glycoprotein [Ambystoma mexicanum]|uniref:small cell adhesion glycoprotein n=1 Tax=Ambystoma mexicanum TaxID=8296 RepID=UPI0037E736E9